MSRLPTKWVGRSCRALIGRNEGIERRFCFLRRGRVLSYPTDVATAKTLLRLVQSIPSAKAEPSQRAGAGFALLPRRGQYNPPLPSAAVTFGDHK
jgi:hypothetical protein